MKQLLLIVMLFVGIFNINIYADEREVDIVKSGKLNIVIPKDLDTKKQLLSVQDVVYTYNVMPEVLRLNIKEVNLFDYPKPNIEQGYRVIATAKCTEKSLSIWQNGEIENYGYFENVQQELKSLLPHEAAHILDYKYEISSSNMWKECMEKDKEHGFDYIRYYYDESEDFAESVSLYVNNPNQFKERYPNRYNFINLLLKTLRVFFYCPKRSDTMAGVSKKLMDTVSNLANSISIPGVPNISGLTKKATSAASAANDVKLSGGTTKAALEAAGRTFQSKPGDSPSSYSPSTSSSKASQYSAISNIGASSKPSVTSALDVMNKVTSNPATSPATSAANKTGNVASSVAQQVQTPQVDPNLALTIQEILKMLQAQNQPKAIPQYQSQYSGQISDLINQFNNRPEFQFDATNNPTILANQKKAADAVTQEMGRRNILQSSITGNTMADRIAEVYATIAPQLEQQAFNQDQAKRQNILQQIQNYMNLDNTDYNRYVNSYNMGQDASQSQFNNTMSIADIINQLDVQNYNKTQDAKNNAIKDAELTGVYNPYAGVQISPEVQQYAGDYQAEINRRRATPDTSDDYLISQLEAARANKIFSSPDLLDKYGDQYKTPAQRAAEYSNLIKQQELELQKDPNSLENQTKLYNLAKAKTELEQLATYGPQEQELKLREIESRISENAASASASYALAQQRKNESSTSSTNGLKYTDYYKAGVEMKNAGTYDDYKNYVPRYSDQQIFTWIDGLPIPREQKAQLAKDIGVSEKVKTVEKTQGPYGNQWN